MPSRGGDVGAWLQQTELSPPASRVAGRHRDGLAASLIQLPSSHRIKQCHDFLCVPGHFAGLSPMRSCHSMYADFISGGGKHPKSAALWSAGPEGAVFTGGMHAPKMATAGICADFIQMGKNCAYLFADDNDNEDEPRGWVKVVPKMLRGVAAFDVFTAFVLLASADDTCAYPLKPWLLAGLALGFPMSKLVHFVNTSLQPRYQYYRLGVDLLRGRGSTENMQLGSLTLYDQLGMPIQDGEIDQHQDGRYWYVTIRDGPELITQYRLVTHPTAEASLDPSKWVLEGSVDGVEWKSLHEFLATGEVPTNRGQSSRLFEGMESHKAARVFAYRVGFLLELAANAASMAWLAAGTTWVGESTDMCVDTAPFLWYNCFIMLLVVWSFLGTVTLGTVVVAVGSVVFGQGGVRERETRG